MIRFARKRRRKKGVEVFIEREREGHILNLLMANRFQKGAVRRGVRQWFPRWQCPRENEGVTWATAPSEIYVSG